MDWRQLIIDNPLLAMGLALPLLGLAALIKIGLTLSTGRGGREDDP
jgi:hypothetical protein